MAVDSQSIINFNLLSFAFMVVENVAKCKPKPLIYEIWLRNYDDKRALIR